MEVSGSRVGIVGGSIAGCAAAIALRRLGCEITVFERSSGALQDRGSGIVIPRALREELVANRYLPAGYPCWPGPGVSPEVVAAAERRWVLDDGSSGGRTIWRQPGLSAAVTNNWSVLWQGLRAQVPDSLYRNGVPVEAVRPGPGGVEIDAGGSSETFDIVVGADGYRSSVRRLVDPGVEPAYAGYILWRSNFPEGRLEDHRAWSEMLATISTPVVAFDGGHGVVYPIPDFAGSGLRVTWAIYAPKPPELTLEGPSSIPPGMVTEEVFSHFERLRATVIPDDLRPLFAGSRKEVSIQPIYDAVVARYAADRLLLIGDAATVSRPHTGSGATKAMQDARLLEELGRVHTEWGPLLAAYDADRTPAGRSIVELGRRLGRDQVESTPPWGEMSEEDFAAWAAGSLSGTSLYFHASGEEGSA